ncbi:uncharacterized protein [Euphorbia lathyris]|uniref:uncharacterized protein n=1 Tax=Euphorbia lathyris TaxID=212925 RepID=UPI00331352CF
MATINNTTSLSYQSSVKFLLRKKPCFVKSPNCLRLFLKFTSAKPFVVRCSSSSNRSSEKGDPGNNLKDSLSGVVGKQVEELLSREENRVLLDGLGKATERVERAKRELAEIEREEVEAQKLRSYVNQLETRASEIAECQQEILEARAKLEEAESYLSKNIDGNIYGDEMENSSEQKGINKDEDRLESIKAASISAIIGTLASLPVSLAQATATSDLILPSAVTFISCALYGVTFRYAVRRDLKDFHLKTGTIAAFAVVKGLGMLAGGSPLELTPGSLLSHTIDGAVYVSENFLIFAFAAVSLDFCFQMRLLSPFPVKKTNL